VDPYALTLSEAARLIRENRLTPLELLESLLQRIDDLEPKLESWVTLDREKAISTAKEYSTEASEGKTRGVLHGIPVGVKDIYHAIGMRTTAGSSILAEYVPGYDATAVRRLRDSGAIILGKTETTEFACFDPAPTRNPWNTCHTPGGSSSGSAAAVSAGMCPAALGSQTGGSVIRPASFCGVVGVKPSYGRISRYGVIPVSWSLDHVGFMTRSVEDAAVVLGVLAGYDPRDASSSTLPVPSYERALDSINPPRLGLVKGFFRDNASEEVQVAMDEVANQLRAAGAKVEDANLPESFAAVHSAHRLIMITEAAAYHEETFRKQATDYRPNLRGMIASGLLVPANSYIKAQRIRSQFSREVAGTFEGHDCLLMPSTTMPAPRGLGSTGDPAFNSPWSFSGLPAVTLPSSLSKDGFPMGIQLVGHSFDEERLLRVAKWCEKVVSFGNKLGEKRLPIDVDEF
jgi:aspartyl-tRNA(Asn)/glutamyl-tRNA(Gln) amidotransferase subunit A